MLAITSGGANKVWGSWHVGEVMNIPAGRVITFQADGHELTAIIEAFKKAGIEVNYPADRLTPVL